MAWLAQEFTEKIKFSSGTHYYAVLSRQLPTSFMNLINLNVVSPELWRIPQFNFPTTCSVCPKTERTLHSLLQGHPLFFLRLTSSDRPKFLEFSKKKKCNYVVEPFFTWNNSFNLKNEHSNRLREKQDQKHEHFLQYVVCLLIREC